MLPHFEQNPLGRLLLMIDGDDVALLVLCKFVGTVLVLGFLVLLYEKTGSRSHYILTPIFIEESGGNLYGEAVMGVGNGAKRSDQNTHHPCDRGGSRHTSKKF